MAEPLLRIRLNQLDWTMALPGALDNAPPSLTQVPIIRVYGQTSLGIKACVHVHQIYRYFYIDYLGPRQPQAARAFVRKLKASLNCAIAISLKRDPNKSDCRFIRSIVLVKGVPGYGFNYAYSPFLKIYVTNPDIMPRAVALLTKGAIMGTRLTVYETHLNFILQFMADFALHGCGWLDIENASIRTDEDEDENTFVLPASRSPYVKESSLKLEIDVIGPQILNRRTVEARNIHHFLSTSPEPLSTGPMIPSVRELWDDERRRRTTLGLSPSPVIPLDTSQRAFGGDWSSLRQNIELIEQRIKQEADFKIEPEDNSWEQWVMTSFQSVEALWERQWRVWKPSNTDGTLFRDEDNPLDFTAHDDDLADYEVDIELDNATISEEELKNFVDQHDLDEEESDHEKDPEVDIFEVEEEPEVILNVEQELGVLEGSDECDRAIPDLAHDIIMTPLSKISDDEELMPSRSASPSSIVQDEEEPNPFLVVGVVGEGGSTTTFVPELFGDPKYKHEDQLPHDFDSLDACSEVSSDSDNESNSRLHIARNSPENSKDDSAPAAAREDDFERSNYIRLDDTSNWLLYRNAAERRKNAQSQLLLDSRDTVSRGPCLVYNVLPPSRLRLGETLLSQHYRDPYYSVAGDIPLAPQEFGGLEFAAIGEEGIGIPSSWVAYPSSEPKLSRDNVCEDSDSDHPQEDLEQDLERDPDDDSTEDPNEYSDGAFNEESNEASDDPDERPKFAGWEFCGISAPPTRRLAVPHKDNPSTTKEVSQIKGPTLANKYGFKGSVMAPKSVLKKEHRGMSVLAMELQAVSLRHKHPDPNDDEVCVVAYSFQSEEHADGAMDDTDHYTSGVFAKAEFSCAPVHGLTFETFELFEDEGELIERVIRLVHELDPDILVGWELQKASWGYLADRAQRRGIDLADLVSRTPSSTSLTRNEQWNLKQLSTFVVTGRHTFNTWRILKGDLALTSYTFQSVAFHVLHKRFPKFSLKTMSDWFRGGIPRELSRLIRSLVSQTSATLDILDKCETITKATEFARVCGIDFFSVFSRGSQFKVESFMIRLAKPESLVLISPSKNDVGKQNAAECMPLIMEPRAAYYKSPLLVLDFQSLYPSVMIAYNYCYTTCIGRIEPFKSTYKFGILENFEQPPGLLGALREHLIVAPNGLVYVKPNVRKGLLSRMLTELLDTRVMVKEAMKLVKSNKTDTRTLDARQQSLKFVANVTYGYTSASFSGRMPAVEVADSIVQSGRETLEKAISLIDDTPEWGGTVVYGDTDSLFVSLPGKTREEAFAVGNAIAATVTSLNPEPIRLKFEKVYFPCVLLAKKRYVGFKYESSTDTEPVFDAKGIETIRRDGVPAQAKAVEATLKILFRTQDLSQVKAYCYDSWRKLFEGRVLVQDFIFAKEVRLGDYATNGQPPPGAVITTRYATDTIDQAQYRERVPYVITCGPPGTKLSDRALPPELFLELGFLDLDAEYYISRVLVPPLQRIFGLVGADVRSWYAEMPRAFGVDAEADGNSADGSKSDQDIEAVQDDERLPETLDWHGEVPQVLQEPETGLPDFMMTHKMDEHGKTINCRCCDTEYDYPTEPSTINLCEACKSTTQETLYSLLSRSRVTESRYGQSLLVCQMCASIAAGEPVRCVSLDCPWMYMREKLKVEAEVWQNEISQTTPASATSSPPDSVYQWEELQAQHDEGLLLPRSLVGANSHVEDGLSLNPSLNDLR